MVAVAVVLLAAFAAPLPGMDAYQSGMNAEASAHWGEARASYQQCATQKGPLKSYAELAALRCAVAEKSLENPKKQYAKLLRTLPAGPWVPMAKLEQARMQAAASEHQAALKAYDAVLDIAPLPWWMESISWERGMLLLEMPGRKKDAYAWFSEVAHSYPYANKRRDAAKILLDSPDRGDLGIAVLALLRSAAYTDADKALKAAPPVLLDAKGKGLSSAEVQALIFPKVWDDMTRSALKQVLDANRNQLWARVWLIHGMRTEAREKRFSASRELCNQLIAYFAKEREAAEGLWWLAQYLAGENGDTHDATVKELYRELVEKFPEHYRGDDAWMRLGELALEGQDSVQALACFTTLISHYPDSRFAVNAASHCARMRQAEQDTKGALLYTTRAAVSGFGTYYGHLALDDLYNLVLADTPRSGRVPVFSSRGYLQCAQPPKPQPPLPAAVLNDPRIQRAFFFGRNGMPEGEWEAIALCSALKTHKNPAPYYQALAEAGYAHTVWQFSGNAGKTAEGLWQRYPRAYWPIYQELAKETGVDPYLLLAISRQESTFRASVRSWAGATGVMQLMPATAKWMVSVEDEIKKEHAAYLTRPENSIRLGAYYLRRMLERSDGNLVYALASYNAGPGNCNKWKKRWPNATMQEFVEAIPFAETQGYVKKVLGNYAAYKSLYGQE